MQINEGDLVKIPQNVLLYSYDEKEELKAYWSCPKPLAAVYLERKMVAGRELAELLLDNELWFTEPENLHQWREYASQTDRSI